jgi:hypothetical protein
VSQTKAELIKGLNINASAPATALQIDASGNVNIDSNTLYVDATNNRVGIGTASPGFLVDCIGSSTPTLRIDDGAGSGTRTAGRLLLGATTSLGVAIENSVSSFNDICSMVFKTTPAAGTITERARLTSDGKFLVGTSSGDTGGVIVRNYQYQATNYMRPLGYYGVDLGMVDNTNTRVWAAITSQYNQGSAVSAGLFLSASHVDTGGSACGYTIKHNKSDHSLAFSYVTTGASVGSPAVETERLRIDSSGRILTGTTSPINDAHTFSRNVANNAVVIRNENSSGQVYGLQIRFSAQDPNNAANTYLECYAQTSNTVRAEIRSNGGLANFSANNANLSDINSKKDISPAAGTWDCIKEWEIVNYRYKDQPDDADLNLGVIAQQVAESCPEVITVFQEAKEATEDKPAQEERLGVKEQQMYWMAIKALQEAQVRIEALEAEVAALKAQ